MKIKHLGKLFVFFILIGCNSFSDETTKLNSVLLHYNESVSDNHHLYIVQSQFYCTGCIQSIYLQLENNLIETDHLPITIISGDKKYISNRLLSKISFINDSLGMANKEFITFLNLTFFETNDGDVVNYKNMGDTKDGDLPKFVTDLFKRDHSTNQK